MHHQLINHQPISSNSVLKPRPLIIKHSDFVKLPPIRPYVKIPHTRNTHLSPKLIKSQLKNTHYKLQNVLDILEHKNKPKSLSEDLEQEAIPDRLTATTEVKKLLIYGSTEKNISYEDGHVECTLKFESNVGENFEESQLEIASEEITWSSTARNFLESGAHKKFDLTIKKFKVSGSMLKLKWLHAIQTILKLIRILKMTMALQKEETSPKRKSLSLLSQLKDTASLDISAIHKIKRLLSIDPHKRTQRDINTLDEFLAPLIKSYASFNYYQRCRFCRIMEFMSVSNGKVIVKQGHIPVNFYFLFAGSCDVYRNNPDGTGQEKTNILIKGDSFGDVQNADDRRSVSVCATDACILLLINIDDYLEIATEEISTQDVVSRLKLLREFPIFSNCDQSMLLALAKKVNVRYYPKGTKFTKQNEFYPLLHFIISGKVTLERRIKLIKSSSKPGGIQKAYYPYDPKIAIQEGNSMVEKIINLPNLKKGDFFPEIVDPTLYRSETQNLINLLANCTNSDVNSTFANSICSLSAVMFEISKLEFVKIANASLTEQMIENSFHCRVSLLNLQKQWIACHQWKMFKLQMLEEQIKVIDSHKSHKSDLIIETSTKWAAKCK